MKWEEKLSSNDGHECSLDLGNSKLPVHLYERFILCIFSFAYDHDEITNFVFSLSFKKYPSYLDEKKNKIDDFFKSHVSNSEVQL